MKDFTHRTRLGRWAAVTVCSLALMICASTLASGQEFRTSLHAIEEARELPIEDGALPLGLEEAIIIALRNNLGLRIERYRRAQSLLGVQQAFSIYDVNVQSRMSNTEEEIPTSSALQGSQQSNRLFTLGLSQLTSYGGTANLSWSNFRREDDNLFTFINPRFTVGLDLTFTQPLLQGFGPLATERNLRVARTTSEISVETLELQVEGTLQQVENGYWILVESREQLKVAQESLELAQELHKMNQIQVDVGTLAPLELITSEAGVATREEEIIRAQAAVEDAADELRRLLNFRDGALWEAEVIPQTDPEIERVEIRLEEAIAVALEERPEIRREKLQLENLELDQRFFRRQKLPSVDLELSYSVLGLGGSIVDRGPDQPAPQQGPAEGYSGALQQALDLDFPTWSLALNVAYPIQNRAARAQATMARLAVEEGQSALQDLELFIKTEVRAAARAVETAAKQIDSARISRRLQERNLEAEQKRYENGLVASFQVLEIQEDLTLARSREVAAITGYRRALVSYYRAIGRLLEDKGIELVDDVEQRELNR